MSAKEERYRIVLGRADANRQSRIAAQIAVLFGVTPEMAAQIVRSAPIVLLSGLGRQQAMELASALAPLREAGAELRIASGEDPSLSHVAWPSPPRLAGRPVNAAQPPGEEVYLACPCCGARLRLAIQPEQAATPKPPAQPPAKPETDTMPAPALLDDIEDDDPLFSPLPPLVESGPFRPLPSLKEFETGMQAAVDAMPAPAKAQPATARAASKESEAATRPALSIADDRRPANGERGPFNVIISGGAGNPKAVSLVKEVLRIAEKDAALLLQKPSLTVAQGVSRETAVKVAARFKAINVAVRITQLKSDS